MSDSNKIRFDVTGVDRPRKPITLPTSRDGGRAAPTLAAEALIGLAGDVVTTIEPYTESSPAALLADFLTSFGSAVGPGPHAYAEAARHELKLFAVIVGATSRARKGTSRSTIKMLFDLAMPEWSASSVTSGMSSGEGLVQALGEVEGTSKRLLVVESEFGRVLTIAERPGSTTSEYFRQLWDGDKLRVMNRTPLEVDGAFLSVIGHITAPELRQKLGQVDMTNGFANRVLWVYAERSKLLPGGSSVPPRELVDLAERLTHAVEIARGLGRMQRNRRAEGIWEAAYVEADRDELPHPLGAITSRAEAQMLRLSLIYAALDGTAVVKPKHVKAAWAFWRYCRDSAAHVFADSTGNPTADKILAALGQTPGRRLSRAAIYSDVFHHNLRRALIDAAVATLEQRGTVRVAKSSAGRGRPTEFVELR